MAKNYFRTYIWLLETLQSKGPLTLKEIKSLWKDSSANSEQKPLATRTFANHRKSIADIFGIDIECDRSDNTYSISNENEMDKSSVKGWMLDALSLGSILEKSSALRDKIFFEEVPSSRKHLTTVIQCLRDNRVLELRYRSYDQPEDNWLTVEPYCLRQFKNRWYLYGRKDKDKTPHMFALDRFIEAEEGEGNYTIPASFDPYAFFSKAYGVRIYEDAKPQIVHLKVSARQSKYFRSLPLHSSQKEIETHEDYSVFEYFLTPDYDFKQDVLSFGTSIEIIKPEELRKDFGKIVKNLNKLYNV